MESLSGKYVKQSLEKCDLLFINVDENDDVRGFATIIFEELGIYIVVICSFALQHLIQNIPRRRLSRQARRGFRSRRARGQQFRISDINEAIKTERYSS